MAQGKGPKHSSAFDGLRDWTADELRALLADPAALLPYIHSYVEERAGEAEGKLLAAHAPVRRRLLCELANMQPDAPGLRWFEGRWGATLRAEPAADLLAMREQLRYLWRRPAMDLAEQVLNGWLAGGPAASERGGNARPLPFACSLGAGLLVPDRADTRAMLIQGVFENWRHLRICANADCVSPYFVAKRKHQLVCDAEICKAEKQRAHALKWWHAHRGAKKRGKG